MQKIKELIAKEIAKEIININSECGITENDVLGMFEYPPDNSLGDIALPCFKLSKTLRMAPVKIADGLASAISSEAIGKATAVNGYLNIFINNEFLCKDILGDILAKNEKYGSSTEGEGKTVVLDYSSPNVAKPFHIGHLGTTVIGHALRKLHEFSGYKCVGINYLGDWGTQFGKLITAYRKWGSREMVEEGGIDVLVDLYVKINNAINDSPELADEARAEFHKLELGDEENLALWKWFIEISLAEYEKTYKQLGIEFDSYKGESFYTDKMPAEVQKLRDAGLLKIDDGASIVDLEEYGMPPCLILKRDGSTLYPTRDIAAAVYRKNEYKFDKAVYVTSAGQCLHFAQWFKVVELMGYEWFDQLVHVPYGTVSLNGAKLATRTGNVILLRDLFDKAIEKVREIMSEKHADMGNMDESAEAVGVGAIVFYYLSNNRMKDINFVLEDALSFDGNTGPYVQYTYARTCSVLEKAGEISTDEFVITANEESELLKTLAKFPEKVKSALDAYEPSIVTRYILDVAAAFNRFYHNCQILSSDDAKIKNTRIMLTKATNIVLGNAFELICMKKTTKI